MKLKHVKTVTKPSGATFTYLAVPGQKLVRLPDGPKDSPEFLLAYATALANAEPAQKGRKLPSGSIAAAVRAYQTSAAFKTLAPNTQAQRRRHLSKIVDRWGDARLSDLRAKHIQGDISPLAPHPANNRRKVWRGFCAWAKATQQISADPSLEVDKVATAKSDGFTPWLPYEIDTFRAHWPIGTAQRLALELIYWTAARASDAVRIGPGMVQRDGWLTFRQKKTGGEVSIPFNRVLPPFATGMQCDLDFLKAAISAAPRHMTWLVTEHGKARSDKAFSSWFAGSAAAAGVIGKSAHGLRKARAMAMAEAGATAHQIAAWTGHESLSEVQRYSKAADRKRILSGVEPEQFLETAPTHTGNRSAIG